ncbi:MAG: 3-deoxy-manno-octulosonate cytidylyltransferase [Calditrichaeota bacterium]|nr:MAG: 3-deoxy-manno-octulosonate cytidylyltransferase [Calditrichota bacterium]
MKVIGVIPARLNSQRFPKKVLYRYLGKPLLYYIHHELTKSKEIDAFYIATDSKEIEMEAHKFGAQVIRTSGKHRTGSDRLHEVSRKVSGDIYVNIQADNFGLKTAGLDRVVKKFKSEKNEEFGTIAKKITSTRELTDPNNVKLTLDRDDHAITFSRFPLPYIRDTKKVDYKNFAYYYHIGIYLFTKSGISKFASWKQSPIEKAESLEQMRILENGHTLKVYKSKFETVSIDTKKDLKKIEGIYK